jgi:hypothetical protein
VSTDKVTGGEVYRAGKGEHHYGDFSTDRGKIFAGLMKK